jgi:hypothetical protein
MLAASRFTSRPAAGKCLVEAVEVKQQLPLRRGDSGKAGQTRVAAGPMPSDGPLRDKTANDEADMRP